MFHDRLTSAVGPGKPNYKNDVRLVQNLLNRSRGFGGSHVEITARFDLTTALAIVAYQRQVMRLRFATGVINPGDETFWRLSETSPRRLLVGALEGIVVAPIVGNVQFSDEHFNYVAAKLGCDAKAVRSVQFVESGENPFDEVQRPTILFERHLFSRFTHRKYDGKFPQISCPMPGGYTWPDLDPYVRLQQAYALDATAALKATSWGGFQILGANFQEAGHPTVESFVRAVCGSVLGQCDAFISFVESEHSILLALRERNWAAFAYHYNGSNYRINHYGTKLDSAYRGDPI